MRLEQMVKKEAKKYEKILIVPDIHVPYEDIGAVHAVIEFSKQYKPDKIKLMGDLVDFYAVSSFDKDPDRILSLQQEIDVAQYYLGKIREANPKAKITMYEGNHEFRLIKYLRKNPELSSLRSISKPDKLLELDKYDIKYALNEEEYGVLFKHGNIVRKHSGYTAKGEFENEGTSGISGHTHRISAHYKTDRSGQHAWYEMGHLCDEDKAEYMKGKIANWQKGFGTLEIDKTNKIWKVEQIPIINNGFLYRGQTYKWRKNTAYPERDLI